MPKTKRVQIFRGGTLTAQSAALEFSSKYIFNRKHYTNMYISFIRCIWLIQSEHSFLLVRSACAPISFKFMAKSQRRQCICQMAFQSVATTVNKPQPTIYALKPVPHYSPSLISHHHHHHHYLLHIFPPLRPPIPLRCFIHSIEL